MPENTFLLNSDKAFSLGNCDNVTQDCDTLMLSKAEGRYIQSGCYTSREFSAPSFSRLIVSWNCDTPLRTATQTEVRVRVNGEWTQWFSYGKWNTAICRHSQSAKGDAACLDTDTLIINGNSYADTFQLRVFLYTDDVQISPRVYMLCTSVKELRKAANKCEALNRSLPVPAYSQKVRNPKIADSISSPTAITMLMNRHGEDILPEQAAHACYDYACNSFDNKSFAMALVGAFGYEGYVAYSDTELLKKEIKNGYACAVSIKYTNKEQVSTANNLPFINDGTDCEKNHFVVVRGFAVENEIEYILINDCAAESDEKAEKKYLLSQFENAWDGITYIFHQKRNNAGKFTPTQQCAELVPSEPNGEYSLHIHGMRTSLPVDFCESDGRCSGTVCYTVKNSLAYASAAHKTFYYTDISLSGNVILNSIYPTDTKLTIYIISRTGSTMTAELRV
ncbi:MAG: C39 family peptidase [Oscillospiraceae bacterium]